MDHHNRDHPDQGRPVCHRCERAVGTVTIRTTKPFLVCRACEEPTRSDMFGESRSGFDVARTAQDDVDDDCAQTTLRRIPRRQPSARAAC
jgi:hypothetical protein